jgi:hypothetical protein
VRAQVPVLVLVLVPAQVPVRVQAPVPAQGLVPAQVQVQVQVQEPPPLRNFPRRTPQGTGTGRAKTRIAEG